jgi:hypothetical protein
MGAEDEGFIVEGKNGWIKKQHGKVRSLPVPGGKYRTFFLICQGF